MNEKEFTKIAMALKTYYPRDNIIPTPEAMKLWFNELRDLPYDATQVALSKWTNLSKWAPTIADIRKTTTEIIKGQRLNWGEAWEEVIRAVKRFGMYQQTEALASMSPLTQKAVSMIGFQTICTSENIGVERASFRMIYEALDETAKAAVQLAPTLVEAIGKLSAGMGLLEDNSHDVAE